MISYQQYLRESAVPRQFIDVFLDPKELSWAKFDPELGYVLGSYLPRDGIGGSTTISTAQANGARTQHLYIERTCRINTYGDSFTQCHQVSDGETWQEYLAAHLGEPVRNFGMGGYGVYQAYRRLVRTERSKDHAEYVLLYIWGDDHIRSLQRCRRPQFYRTWDDQGGRMFHCNFWSNMEIDLDSGELVERSNILPTPESLYRMSEPDFLVEALGDDLALQLSVAPYVDPATLDRDRLLALADILEVADVTVDDLARETVGLGGDAQGSSPYSRLLTAYGFAATRRILRMAASFCDESGKKLLVCLFCPFATRQLLTGQSRYDQEIVDFLDHEGLGYFDMNRVHLDDYRSFSLSPTDYMRRYSIGHYSPAGNHFFAYSIKDRIVDWLDPKPVTYRTQGQGTVDFTGYLAAINRPGE